MKKFYISNKEDLNEYELNSGCVSYRRIIDRYIQDLVLCNNVVNIGNWFSLNGNKHYMDCKKDEIYQYYLCNLNEFEKETLTEYGIILTYSEELELDILCVDHWGTSWDYVLTDVKWTTDYNET